VEGEARIVNDGSEPAFPWAARTDETRRVCLNELVEQAIAAAQPRAATRGVSVEARHDAPFRMIEVNDEQLRCAIAHLLLYALRFSQHERPLVVWTHLNSQFAEIGVRNAGAGVRPRMLAPNPGNLWQARHVESVEALGFDMTLAKRLVDILDGHLELRTAARRGAPPSMLIRLPADTLGAVAATPPERCALSRAGATPRLDGTHVLLVEDDPDALEFLALVLRAAGADVTCHSYPEAAFAFFTTATAANRPDVVVSDIAMPLEDGYSFLRRLRSWEGRTAALPVHAIAVTAFSRDEDCRLALAAGFDRHVSKPLDAARLVATIAHWT